MHYCSIIKHLFHLFHPISASRYESKPPHSHPPPHPGRLRWHVVALLSKEVVWELQSCRAPSCRNTDCPGVDTSPPRPVKSGEVGGGEIKGT